MTFRPTPTFAPDGFATTQQREAGTGHRAAASVSGERSSAPRAAKTDHARRNDHTHTHYNNHDGYDEGLVHSHTWAASE
jgi:hypothetical protein